MRVAPVPAVLALLLACLSAACAAGSRRPQPPPPGSPAMGADALLAARVDSIVEAARAGYGIPGLSVVVRQGGRTLLARGYGTADLQSGAPATLATVYQIGSISKQFTAAAVLRLAERGALSLDDPVTERVPGVPPEWGAVRLRHLLHQTSGVQDFLFLPEFGEQSGDVERPTSELLDMISRQPLQFVPGERWSYSNSNYTLLAAAIEHAAGKPYDEFLRDEFFRPLALSSIHHCRPHPSGPVEARGYGFRGGAVVPAPPENMNWARGDGGLCATVEDLARWAEALAAGRVVSARSYARMTASERTTDGVLPSYGFGLSLVPLDGARAKVAHHGAMTGFTGMVARYPEDALVVAVLTNRGGLWIDPLEKAVARAVLGLPAPRPREAALDARERRRFAGVYDMGPFDVRVVEREGRLWMEAPPPVPSGPLLYQGEGTFVSQAEPDGIGLRFGHRDGPAGRLVLSFAGMHWYGRPR